MINISQALIFAAIAIAMAAYNPNGARFRVGLSALSGLIMGSSASLAVAFYYGKLEANWLLVILSLAALARVVKCRGDSARVLRIRP